MNFQVADNNEKKGRSCADGYIDAMHTLMGNRENIVHMVMKNELCKCKYSTK